MNLSTSNEVGMSVALFFGILLCLEIGFRIGLASSKKPRAGIRRDRDDRYAADKALIQLRDSIH